MASGSSREAALADFETARSEWAAAFESVPDGALGYLKPGDDYSLGGLQTHVNWVLLHYRRVLDGIVKAGCGDVGPQDRPHEAEEAGRRARQAMTADERRKALDEMERLHSAVASAASRLADDEWACKAPVVYGPGQEPYPTSAEDVIGWVRDHYREHVEQSSELVAAWEKEAWPRPKAVG